MELRPDSLNRRVFHLLNDLPTLPDRTSDYETYSERVLANSRRGDGRLHVPLDPYDPSVSSNPRWTFLQDSSHKSLEKLEGTADTSLDSTIAPRPPGWSFFVSLAAVLSCAFLYGLDTTIAADVQASIYESLGEIGKIAWVGVGFPLGSAGTILPIGYAYGKFNLKVLFLGGLVLIEGGSVLCGAAPSMNALIAGRVIAGIGGCSIYLGGLNFVTVYTTLKERSIYNALVGTVWAIGTILGPVIGGAFASSGATWRWAFYINLCLFAIIGPVCLFIMPAYQPHPHQSAREKLKNVDWIGTVLIVAIFVLSIMALSFGGNQWAWKSYKWITMTSVWFVCLVAFVIQQKLRLFTTPDDQVFPVRFLKRMHQILFYITMSSSASVFFFSVYYIPLYFQFAHEDSALQAAIRLLPFIGVAVGCMMFQGAMMPILRYYPFWYIIGGAFSLVGGVLMHSVTPSTSISQVYGFTIFLAVGSGICTQGGYALSAAKTKGIHEIALSVAFMNIAQIGSVAIALAVSGQIFQNFAFQNLNRALGGHGFTEAEIRNTVAGTKSAVFQRGSLQLQKAAIAAITDAIGKVYIQAIACGALNLLLGCVMKWEKLDFVPGATPA